VVDAGAATTDESTTTTDDPGTAWTIAQAKRFSDAADTLRGRTDLAAKGLGGLGTAAVSAIGIAKVSDIFPLPPGETVSVVFLGVGFGLMVLAILALTSRFWSANRPLLPTSSPTTMEGVKEIDPAEEKIMDAVYTEAVAHAAFSTGPGESLEDYEERADKLERESQTRWGQVGLDAKRRQVARMRAEIDKAQQRAKLVVVRRRLNQTLNSLMAALWAFLFVIGLVGFGVSADHLESQRSDLIATDKSCAEAVKAKVPPKALPRICDKVTGTIR
jgi:Na+-transporting methylmalonyl-CoA/oxaloacetate decarboxylase gamma subunit